MAPGLLKLQGIFAVENPSIAWSAGRAFGLRHLGPLASVYDKAPSAGFEFVAATQEDFAASSPPSVQYFTNLDKAADLSTLAPFARPDHGLPPWVVNTQTGGIGDDGGLYINGISNFTALSTNNLRIGSAVFTATVVNGEVTALNLTRVGDAGHNGPQSILIVDQGGAGSGAQFETTVTSGPVGIVQVMVTARGSGYTSAPIVTISAPPSGVTATALAVLHSGYANGVYFGYVMGIYITNPGSGYTSEPTVTISGGGGTGATATANLARYVTGATKIAGGGGYSAKTVAFAPTGGNDRLDTFTWTMARDVINPPGGSHIGDFSFGWRTTGSPSVNAGGPGIGATILNPNPNDGVHKPKSRGELLGTAPGATGADGYLITPVFYWSNNGLYGIGLAEPQVPNAINVADIEIQQSPETVGQSLFTRSNVFTNVAQTFRYAADSSSPGYLVLDRQIPSAAPGNYIFEIYGQGRNSAGAAKNYGGVVFQIISETAGAETGQVQVRASNAGAANIQMVVGKGVWLPGASAAAQISEGDLAAKSLYDNDGSVSTCYPLEQWATGAVDIAKWDARAPDTVIPGEPARQVPRMGPDGTQEREKCVVRNPDGSPVMVQVERVSTDATGRLHSEMVWAQKTELVPLFDEIPARPDRVIPRSNEDARRFLARLGTAHDPMTIAGIEAHIREKGHLWAFPNPETFDPKTEPKSIGSWLNAVKETLDVFAIHLIELKRENTELKQRIDALERP